ncbi:MAG: L,D-transpeptidase [Pseudomonadota bacterium]
MTRKTVLLLTTAIIAMPVAQAEADSSRYSTPPAVVLSPDLTAPWLLQLKRPPTASQKAKVRLYQPKPKAKTKKRKSWSWNVNKKQNRRATGIFAAFNREDRSSVARSRSQTASQSQTQTAYARVQTPAPQSSNAQAAAYIQKQAAQRPIDPKFLPQVVNFESSQKPGTIIIDTNTKFLYLVLGDGQARRYGMGVGKEGFEWKGTENISRKAEWPSWRPPQQMIERERAKGRELPAFMEGGPANPMGARALYLGSTLYRIHGTNQPWTIGQAVSSGCIRMRNEDVMDLYERAKVGAKVVVT